MDGRGTPLECSLCPICLGFQAFRQLHPETARHLENALRELLLAASAFFQEKAGREPERPIQRVEVE